MNGVDKMAVYQFVMILAVALCLIVSVGVLKSNKSLFFKLPFLLVVSVLVLFFGIIAKLMAIMMIAFLIIPVYLCIRGVK